MLVPSNTHNAHNAHNAHRRWLEYSLSASLMMVGIAVVTAIRDQNTLLSLFMLSFSTMCCGLLTELHSRPALASNGEYDTEHWQGQPIQPAPDENALYREYVWKKRKNYLYRIIPHILGIFPYVTAWFIILNNFYEQIDDLCEKLRDRMPDFVSWVIFGSMLIFTSFTFVQLRYQWTAPKWYYRSELVYCALSATAKVYLGAILFLNILNAKRFDDAVSLAGSNWTALNITAYCV